jgi:hypothetical protein
MDTRSKMMLPIFTLIFILTGICFSSAETHTLTVGFLLFLNTPEKLVTWGVIK